MPSLDTYDSWVRLIIVVLGFVAIWAMGFDRARKRGTWSKGEARMWTCLLLFIFFVTSANGEYMYRQVGPSWSTYALGFVMLMTIIFALKDASKS